MRMQRYRQATGCREILPAKEHTRIGGTRTRFLPIAHFLHTAHFLSIAPVEHPHRREGNTPCQHFDVR